jgi:hypothetical protein
LTGGKADDNVPTFSWKIKHLFTVELQKLQKSIERGLSNLTVLKVLNCHTENPRGKEVEKMKTLPQPFSKRNNA